MQRQRLIWCVVGLVAFAGGVHAAPKPKPPATLSAELARFAKDMATAFDEVYAHVAAAKKLEAGKKFSDAGSEWRSVSEGAKDLTQNAMRAGAVGGFQDPMTFDTKAGRLTPKTYLAQLAKLQAEGEAGWTRTLGQDDQAQAQTARAKYVASIAVHLASLEEMADKAKQQIKRKPASARIAFLNVARGAASMKQSVVNAERLKRAPANASYPVKPKPMSATELATRLTRIERDATSAIAALDKTLAATAKPAPTTAAAGPAARKPGSPARPGNPPRPGTPASDVPVETAPPAEPAAATCSPEGELHCDDTNMHLPCCAGTKCLPAGWVDNGKTNADGYPYLDPEYYSCLDPVLAPSNPNPK